MNFTANDLNLYLVTDRRWLKEPLEDVVDLCIENGVSFVQLREKRANEDEFLDLAKRVKKVTDKHNVPFVINDNVKIAKLIDADGVHIGQEDMALENARKLLGKDKIIGVSVGSLEEAIEAEKGGADYLGVGSIFKTKSKSDAEKISIKDLEKITSSVSIPCVGIGGINEKNIGELKGSGLDGVALISAILKAEDIESAAKTMCDLSRGVFYERGNI